MARASPPPRSAAASATSRTRSRATSAARATTGSSRTTSATASARPCTSPRTCPTTAGPAAASGWSRAWRSPSSRWSSPASPGRRTLDDDWTVAHRRRLAGRALRAHLHPHPARRLGAHRPRRRGGQARRARRPLRRPLSLSFPSDAETGAAHGDTLDAVSMDGLGVAGRVRASSVSAGGRVTRLVLLPSPLLGRSPGPRSRPAPRPGWP